MAAPIRGIEADLAAPSEDSRRPSIHLPFGLMRAQAAVLEKLPNPPVTRDQLTMLEAGDNVVTNSDAVDTFGVPLVPLDEQLRRSGGCRAASRSTSASRRSSLTFASTATAWLAKRQLVEQDGLLEYYPVATGLEEVAGLSGLKSWLQRRRAVVADPRRAEQFGLSFPKGVLLLGVPGCGKSLCAKAVACEWGLPLLKLDPGNLYDKYIGDSEKNFKRAMQTAERMAPIVLWIDELEKAFASVNGDSDGGVSGRVFGSFLSWLQDRKGDVFVVATSNDVSKLPPEFIRKGRFDEIFFVDLPQANARAEIFRIHLGKRRQDTALFDLTALAIIYWNLESEVAALIFK